jgi:tripartite-type tricarboxylate transporter receptor subunit TctC
MRLRSGVLAALALLGTFGQSALAADDDYPKRQIKIIVPFPAGAGPDQVARMLGQHLGDAWGQSVVVENRTGALGSIGAQEVAREPAGWLHPADGNQYHPGGQCRDAEKSSL